MGNYSPCDPSYNLGVAYLTKNGDRKRPGFKALTLTMTKIRISDNHHTLSGEATTKIR